MQVLLLVTHEYHWLVQPFAYCWNRYWGVPVTVVSDRELPLPDGFQYMRVPAYTEGLWPWEHWFGNGLRSVLAEIEDELVVIVLPDHWLSSPVYAEGIEQLAEYMSSQPRIFRANLTAGTEMDVYGQHLADWRELEIIYVLPTDIHAGLMGGCSVTPSFWRRKALFDLLEPHWDLWRFETVGTAKVARLWPEWMAIGTRQPLLYRAHVLHHAQPRTVNLLEVRAEDREVVRPMIPAGWKILE